MKYILLIYLFISINLLAQTDWERWGKTEIDYKLPQTKSERNYSFAGDNIFEIGAKSLINTYWFFISDVDGDNCPFTPSCSSFFIQSVKEENIIKGTLMFVDRFTRDINFVKRHEHYPRIKGGRYYDPPSLYSLNESKIKYIPPSVILSNE